MAFLTKSPSDGLLLVVVAVLILGIAIPKITLHDKVQLTGEEQQCLNESLTFFDNPFENLAIKLGKLVITRKENRMMYLGAYTIFGIHGSDFELECREGSAGGMRRLMQ